MTNINTVDVTIRLDGKTLIDNIVFDIKIVCGQTDGELPYLSDLMTNIVKFSRQFAKLSSEGIREIIVTGSAFEANLKVTSEFTVDFTVRPIG